MEQPRELVVDATGPEESEQLLAESPDLPVRAPLQAFVPALPDGEELVAPEDKVQLPRYQQIQGGDERPTFEKRLILDLEQDEEYLKLRDEIRRQIEATKKRGEILDLSQSPSPVKETKAAFIIQEFNRMNNPEPSRSPPKEVEESHHSFSAGRLSMLDAELEENEAKLKGTAVLEDERPLETPRSPE